jgi:hypothetical protein
MVLSTKNRLKETLVPSYNKNIDCKVLNAICKNIQPFYIKFNNVSRLI